MTEPRDQAEALRLRAAVERARAAVNVAPPDGLAAALRRLRDAAAAAGEIDLARAAFEAERTGARLAEAAPASAPETRAAAPAEETAVVRPVRVRIGVNADRAPAARRRVVRRTLERTFEVVAWTETEAGAEADLRADPAAVRRLLGGIPDVTFEIDVGEDQTSRMTVAA